MSPPSWSACFKRCSFQHMRTGLHISRPDAGFASAASVLLAALRLLSATIARAQTVGTCEPLAERGTRVLGCYITARESLGPLPTDAALRLAAGRCGRSALPGCSRSPISPGAPARDITLPLADPCPGLAGDQCLETPKGKLVQMAGGPGVLVPGGKPMILVGGGTTIRRSLVLILQDATKPRSMLATDWSPLGLCGS